MMVDGIHNVPANFVINTTLYDDHLKVKPCIGKNEFAILSYSKITNVTLMKEDEIKEKDKSVVGRAVVGGLVFGGLGTIIEGVS